MGGVFDWKDSRGVESDAWDIETEKLEYSVIARKNGGGMFWKGEGMCRTGYW